LIFVDKLAIFVENREQNMLGEDILFAEYDPGALHNDQSVLQ